MLIIVSGYMHNTQVAVDALSIWLVTVSNPWNLLVFFKFLIWCVDKFSLLGSITIYGWESMIPLGFLAATGYVTGGTFLSLPLSLF